MLNQTSSRSTVMNLKSEVSRTGLRIAISMPVCSKYGATKSITSSRSAVIFIEATAKSISPTTSSPTRPSQRPSTSRRCPKVPLRGATRS
ncbi:uncharacterized protein LOC125956459 [Anopheles darlingi]|uniref:uncharacterized protein LOC125956459 n=1 Tax=Anopheles darlingi TaxID=43151 RepID=UPI0021001A15|nr:uncharacterized protein LOC125956459 [Anopheles darlingi]